MRALFPFLLSAVLAFAAPVHGQEGAAPASVLTVDLEKIARESDYGQRVNGLYQAEILTLQSQAKQVEAELIAEEQDLVARRDIVSPEEFKELSQAFDRKVVAIREDQNSKQSELQAKQRDDQRNLLRLIAPILYEIVSARGASVLIDRRNIVLDLSSVDITDEAIAKMNETLGDGSTPTEATQDDQKTLDIPKD